MENFFLVGHFISSLLNEDLLLYFNFFFFFVGQHRNLIYVNGNEAKPFFNYFNLFLQFIKNNLDSF